MRKAFIAIASLVLLSLAGIAALAIMLPQLVERPEVRQSISDVAEEALGRPVDWDTLGVGLLPPRLLVESVTVLQPDAAGAGVSLKAERIALELAFGALLSNIPWPLIALQLGHYRWVHFFA